MGAGHHLLVQEGALFNVGPDPDLIVLRVHRNMVGQVSEHTDIHPVRAQAHRAWRVYG